VGKDYWTLPRMSVGHRHKWMTDGFHRNEFCSVCFVDSPRWRKCVAESQRREANKSRRPTKPRRRKSSTKGEAK
jgi:hypothetical protein